MAELEELKFNWDPDKYTICNAVIEDTQLGFENGIFTFTLVLSGDGWGVHFGSFSLDEWSEKDQKRVYTAEGLECVARILETLGYGKWEDLKGNMCRVVVPPYHKSITEIGHIMKNKWFDVRAFLNEKRKPTDTPAR